jgi:hypothetical protein
MRTQTSRVDAAREIVGHHRQRKFYTITFGMVNHLKLARELIMLIFLQTELLVKMQQLKWLCCNLCMPEKLR